MRSFDLSPLFRSTITFDPKFDLPDDSVGIEAKTGYPPHDIEKTGDDSYRLTLAVAGFKPEELNVVAEGMTLTVTGEHKQPASETYFYHGIAGRSFKRTFELAEYIKVTGAQLENGLLSIQLKREIPEAMKPRSVPVTTVGATGKAMPFSAVA